MKVYEICLRPASDFSTPLMGDTMFGHICWQMAHDPSLLGDINQLLADYITDPFCVVSDPIMKFSNSEGDTEYIMPKPFCPVANRSSDLLSSFDEREKEYDERKKSKKAAWMLISTKKKLTTVSLVELLDLNALRKKYGFTNEWVPIIPYRQTHNSIDRYTGTTGTESQFAPYSLNLLSYNPDISFSIFIGIKNSIDKKAIKTALERIGNFGYGADATTGKGRFQILSDMNEIDLDDLGTNDANALYTLSAMIPEKNLYKNIYFEPFIRFGRHGSTRANSDFPFKQPVLKASAGAVVIPNNFALSTKPYIGRAVTDLSKFKDTVEQGYSLVIPMKVE